MNVFKTLSVKILTVSFVIALIFLWNYASDNYINKDFYENESKILDVSDIYDVKVFNRKYENNALYLDFQDIQGKITLNKIKSTEDSIITIKFKNQSLIGNYKIVYVDSTSQIISLFDKSIEGSISFKANEGDGYVKIVGNDASGSIQLFYEIPKSVEIH